MNATCELVESTKHIDSLTEFLLFVYSSYIAITTKKEKKNNFV